MVAASATLATLSISTLIALIRLPLVHAVTATTTTEMIRTLSSFNPVGLSGVLQAALVPFLGLGAFWIAAEQTQPRLARRQFVNVYCLGLALVLATPLVQVVFLDPTVRPQEQATEVHSLVAFFQDPHSLAAYLILSFGVALGSAGRLRSLPRRLAGCGLAAGSAILLLYTESRSGLAALIVCFLVYSWSPTLARILRLGMRQQRLAVIRSAGAALGVVLTVATIWLVAPIRTTIYDGLVLLGNKHMWEPLNPAGPEHPFLARRFLHLEKSRILVSRYPIWGTGPQGYQDTSVEVSKHYLARYAAAYGDSELADGLRELRLENAHNYYLQYAAEYGLPATATLLALVFLVMAHGFRSVGRGSCADQQLARGLTASMLGFLFLSLVSHPLLLPELQITFWSLCGLTLNLGRDNEKIAEIIAN